MSIKEQVESVLRKRVPFAAALLTVESQMQTVKSELALLEVVRAELAQKIENEEVRANLDAFSVRELQAELEAVERGLAKLVQRFSRSRIQIGVLGYARQGKSTLLQSLTGLRGDIIPSGDRMHCTGALSVLVHDERAESPAVKVHFYGEGEFLQQIIRPYYDFFRDNFPHLVPQTPPLTVEQFAARPLSNNPDGGLQGSNESRYKRLLRYQQHLAHYRYLLGSDPRQIPPAEIVEYVAQTDRDNHPLSNFMAVKQAVISSRFPRVEVGTLAFVDMPGLGDTGLGDEQRIIANLEDVDLVFLVRLPADSGAHWASFDTVLYDLTRRTLGHLLPVQEWQWLVINRRKNPDNLKNCQDLLSTMEENGIRVARAVIADCSDSREVQSLVLEPALEYLGSHLEKMDASFLGNVAAALAAFRSNLAQKLAQARGLFNKEGSVSDAEFFAWHTLFNSLWSELTLGIETLLRELQEHRKQPDQHLDDAVQRVLRECSEEPGPELIPGIEELTRLHAGTGNWRAASGIAMEQVRSALTRRFLALDLPLDQVITETKQRVLDVLHRVNLLPRELTGAAAFAHLEHISTEAGCGLLAESFRFIGDFNLTYFGLLHHRIRQHLDPLMPDENHVEDPSDADDAATMLREAIEQVVYEVSRTLRKIVHEPSMAQFAMVEEFRDLSLRRKKSQAEWERFSYYWREYLWPENFSTLKQDWHWRRAWLESVESVERLTKDQASLNLGGHHG